MVPYAAYYTATSMSLLVEASWGSRAVGFLDENGRTEVLITEPRTIIRNLHVGQFTYLLSGGVLMWDAPYLWATYLVPAF